ncbi:MAG: hypothetical protein K1X81_11085 [Bacteroidia bacterium]|nr:hypothetical protein [Bacteroidia bacterium]
MNKPHKIIVLFCCISLLYAGCKKEDEVDKLPPATASGLGTFGCLINGRAWPIYEKGYHYASAYYENKSLVLEYLVKPDELSPYVDSRIGIGIKKIQTIGNYIIHFDDLNSGAVSVSTNGIRYSCADPINAGGFAWVNITRLDTSQFGYASGTFGFTLLDDQGLTTVKIESGRFDVRLY